MDSAATDERQQVFWNRASCGEELYLKSLDRAGYEAQARARYDLDPISPSSGGSRRRAGCECWRSAWA